MKNQGINAEDFMDSQNYFQNKYLKVENEFQQKNEDLKQKFEEKANGSLCSFKNEDQNENLEILEEVQNLNQKRKQTHNKSTGQHAQSDDLQQDFQMLWNQDFESQQSNQASQNEYKKDKEIIGSYYSKNQEISVIIEMAKDQEDEITSIQESAGIRKNSVLSKYTTTYVMNQHECLSNSSVAHGSLSQPNMFKQHFNSQQRSRKQKRQSINFSLNEENKLPDNLTVTENIIDEQDPNLIQPCIISNTKNFSSNFKNILEQSALVNLKDDEKQEFLEFLKEENEKEIEKEKRFNLLQKELNILDNNVKHEKGLHQQELDSHKLQIWILEDKIQQMNDQIDQIKFENDSHSQNVTDIVQKIQGVKSEIQTRQNLAFDVQKEYDQYKNIQSDLLQKKASLENEFIIISKESEEEQSKLKVEIEEKAIRQLEFDELTIKQQDLENQMNMISQNKNNFELQMYKLKKEIVKLDEDVDDNKQVYERDLLEKDMYETQLSFYLKQQSILTKDIDIFQKKKQFHQDFIHYGDKNNKQLFKIIQDNFLTIDNLKSFKLQIEQDIERLTNEKTDLQSQIDYVQTYVLNLNSNLDQLCNLSNNINNVGVDIKQDQRSSNEIKGNQVQIQENIKIQVPQTNFHTRVNSIQITNTIQNSRQDSTCHTRSQTVCEDELNQFYQNIRKSQPQKNQYFVDEPDTYREQIINNKTLKDCNDQKFECITIQNQFSEQFQQKENQPKIIFQQNNNPIQNEILKKCNQKVKDIPLQQNKSPFDLNNIFISKNSQISQDAKSNWDMPLTKTLQNCVPLNQKNSKKFQIDQQVKGFQNICESKENLLPSKVVSDINNKNEINLSFVNPLRKCLNNNNHKKTQSKSSDFDKLNMQKMNLGKQLNRYIDEIEHKNNKNKQQYNQICATVKNIIKKSDRNYIIDKKSKRTNKSSEYSMANGSKCSTFRQNIESDKKLTIKNEIATKAQIDKKNKCLARFVQSKNLEIPDEPQRKQKLKQFIKTDMPEQSQTNQYQNKLNEDLEKTFVQRSQSQSMNSTQIFEKNYIRNSLPFRKKQDKSLDISKGMQKFHIPLENIINYEAQYQCKEGSQNINQQQMYKSKTAQRLIQQNQFISQRTQENFKNKYDTENVQLKCDVNQKNSFPLRASSSNQQILDIKQKYQSDTLKSNIKNSHQMNLGTSVKQTDEQIKYSKPLRQNKNLSHTICSESHALSPGHLKFNSEIDDCLSSQFQKINQKKDNQNNVISPDIKYRVFKKSISSNLLTGQKDLDLSFKSSQDFKFKSKFAQKSMERKTPVATQNHQHLMNEIFKSEINKAKDCYRGKKQIQDSYFTDGFQQDQSKSSELANQNIQKQTSLKYSKYLIDNLKKNSITSEQGVKYFNIAQKQKNISNSISNPNNISSIENIISQQSASFENSQNQLFKVIQKEFISHGELSLKSNFAKRKFEMHIDQNQPKQKSKGADNVQNQGQILSQSIEHKKSSSINKKSKYSKLSQFLQPISKYEEASSKNFEQKDQKFQQKLQEELKILQEQIFLDVKNEPSSPKQPKSAFIGRKKGKIQDDILSSLNDQMQILQPQKNIPATPNDSMKKAIPLNIYEGETLRNKSLINSHEKKNNCKISDKKYLREDKENISPTKSTVKSKKQNIIVLDQEKTIKNMEYNEYKDQLKEDLYSDDSHISLREQDEIISQLKSNKEIINHY